MNKLVAPSIFAADFYDMKRALKIIEKSRVDMIHYDVMDNHFVPNISFGKKFIEDITRRTLIPANVHLMIELDNIEKLKDFAKLPVSNITLHLESSTKKLLKYIEYIKKNGKTAGISIKPDTPVERLKLYLDSIQLILVMSVEPGFSGQKFLKKSISKIKRLKSFIGDRNIIIQVDGGIDRENYMNILESGADFLVIGSCFFSDKNPSEWVKKIHSF